ncbi:MAG: bifunctional demethylmenaquinone methyltransferase/2-methoxy-6-polyprenyl-1,4-benzoquinol methylase UbiE [Candidatus Didemnitutus sp.]|nr:bifunctional demethylmenaquinone methyltransferase/2-methoxy-6-polyprenyl-1,4-benzoquinol methylase UbiE [Candidatus Didemnitutus sp.]
MPDANAVRSMFSRIAGRYDVANHLLSGGVDFWWRRVLVRRVHDTAPRDILDLATGSGDVAFALADGLPPGVRITGMDFCQPMLDEAVKKREGSSRWQPIDFRQGDGMALPLGDAQFDALTISFGLRNMADRHKSLTEMRRVLRPGGRLFVLEFSQPFAWFRPVYYTYLKFVLPSIAAVVTGDRGAYEYLCGSIEQFPDREAMSAEIMRAGFRSVRATPLTFGIVALHEAQV